MSNYLAIYVDNAYYAVGIVDFVYGIEDYCITESYAKGVTGRRTRNKIYTDANGKQYIRKNGDTLYLDKFMRKQGL